MNYLKKNWRNLLACACLWLADFTSSAAFSILAPFFPEEVSRVVLKISLIDYSFMQVEERKGYSSAITGLIISISPLCVVIFSPVFGYFVSRPS